MRPERVRNAIIIVMVLCSTMLFVFPINPQISTEVLFDDEAKMRVVDESIGNSTRNSLVIRFTHDDGERLTDNLSRIQALMELERETLDGSNPDTSWDASHVIIERIITPMQYWSDAFAVHNRSLENASQWSDVMEPVLSDGWCGNGSSDIEISAFEATLMLLPKDSTFNIACPEFAGSVAEQPPKSNELLWMVFVSDDIEGEAADWGELYNWAEKISENTEFEVEAIGVNMMFAKAKSNAIDDLYFILPLSFVILAITLTLGLRDFRAAGITLGGVGLVIGAELGFLAAIEYPFSVIDGIGIPIILGVAVDGAFWYTRSSRDKDEVRSMLFVAMMTTLAAVSLALLSPIKAQRSLALIIAIGIISSWAMTRFVLEEMFLSRREKLPKKDEKFMPQNSVLAWGWPIGLLGLMVIALVSPSGVSVMNIEQFLEDGDPVLDTMDDMKTKYGIIGGADVWIVIDAAGDSTDDLNRIQDFTEQLVDHPTIINIDSGIYRSPLVMGLGSDGHGTTIDEYANSASGSLFLDDPRLQSDGVTTGIAMIALIDGNNTDAALQFKKDVENLLESNNLSGLVGGDLPIGTEVANTFGETRISQIIFAGIAVFFVALYILNSTMRASRIAIGTVAVGIALDGLAWYLGGRGVASAPAVLLGMGFAADYLSHASGKHAPTRKDTEARWGAAITSASAFILLSVAVFPPAQSMGKLLTAAITISITLATLLSFNQLDDVADEKKDLQLHLP